METPIVLPITKNMSAIDEAGLQGRFARASPTKAPPKPLRNRGNVIQADATRWSLRLRLPLSTWQNVGYAARPRIPLEGSTMIVVSPSLFNSPRGVRARPTEHRYSSTNFSS